VYELEFDRVIASRRLYYRGYIYAQKPHIDPVELQGIQIRIRGVGIGRHDRTWLGYPFDEGLKFGQITGEVFVQDGLESALNIDRASFRETDPHYLTLRADIWSILRQRVFPEFKSRQEVYRRLRSSNLRATQKRRLEEALSDAPEPVGVSTRLEPKASASKIKRRAGWTSKVALNEEPDFTNDRQSLVRVEEGEAVIDALIFKEAAGQMREQQKQILLDVCTVLAAYGLWDTFDQQQALGLFKALAAAVAHD
jgi:hypothetical protein